MNTNNKNDDALRNLFHRLPEEELPVSFREKMMEKVMHEAIRIKKRNERLSLLALILACLFIVALAVLSIIYMKLPKIEFSMPELTSMPFYLYIGVLALILLGGDYLFRKRYMKKHRNDFPTIT